MKMKISISKKAGLGFLFLSVCLCVFLVSTSSVGAAGQTVLKAAYYQPVGHPLFELGKESLSNVEKLTSGRVKVELYPSSTLVPTVEMASGVDEGTAFCALWYMPYMSKTIPLFNIETLAIWSSGQLQTVLDAYEKEGLNDLYTEALHRQGLKNTKIAGVGECLWRVLGTKKVVRVPADIKGVKIRSVGAEADMLKSMGGSPINVTNDQTYEALSRGIADGATNSFMMFVERGFLEYLKYFVHLNLSPVLMHIIYNTKELQKLDPRDRPIVEKAMKDVATHTREGLNRINVKHISEAPAKYGTVFYDLTPADRQLWVKGASPVNERFIKLKDKDPLVAKALDIVYKSNPPVK
ncbi:MAG: TRAP transporter substrate-binding protein DctP [Ignavibacteriaceae bacterium]|jgi:TRAP-type C4-dicarboxylate transport system substrate-binding protein|nr:TRAP transporter substrate-binding protein DctP [Ignavibacteriaceae bacterium]